LRGVARVESDVKSAYKVQQVIDAAYLSASEDGAPVKIEIIH
jgi:hypothetical protein